MKVIILLAGLFISSSLLAAFPEIKINSFNGSFTNFQGNGNATHFVLSKAQDDYKKSNVKIQYHNNELNFDVEGRKYVMALPEDTLKAKDKFSWSNVNILGGGRAVNGSVVRVSADVMGIKGSAEELAVNCTGQSVSNLDWTEQLLDFCTTDSQVTIEEMTKENLKNRSEFIDAIANILTEALPELADNLPEGGLSAKDFDLTVKSHSFNLKVKVKFGMYVSVTAQGYVYYLVDSKTVRVRLDKVVAVFVPVTDKVFEELEKISSEKIRVERPNIYLSL